MKKTGILITAGLLLSTVLGPVTNAAAAVSQGVDWSKYQSNSGVYGYASDQFVITQVGGAYGNSYVNQSTYLSQIAAARARGMRVHTYIWFQVGNSMAYAKSAMDYFLPKVATPKGSIVALDFEAGASGDKAGNTNAILYAMKRVRDAGYTPMLYSSAYYLRQNAYPNQIVSQFGNCLWIAGYPLNGVRSTPPLQYKPTISGMAIWQFTSTYKQGGLDGNIDFSGITTTGYADFTALNQQLYWSRQYSVNADNQVQMAKLAADIATAESYIANPTFILQDQVDAIAATLKQDGQAVLAASATPASGSQVPTSPTGSKTPATPTVNVDALAAQLEWSMKYTQTATNTLLYNKLQSDILVAQNYVLTPSSTTQAQVDAMVATLKADGQTLLDAAAATPTVDLTALQTQLGWSLQYSQTATNGVLYAKLQADIKIAQGYVTNPTNITQSQVDAIMATLKQDGMALLNAAKPKADVSALQTQLGWSTQYSQTATNGVLYAKLQADIKIAQGYVADPTSATQAQVDAIAATLKQDGVALLNAAKPKADVSALQTQLGWSIQYTKTTTNGALYAQLQADIKTAQGYVADPTSATQAQVDAIAATLKQDGVALINAAATPTQTPMAPKPVVNFATLQTQLGWSTKYKLTAANKTLFAQLAKDIKTAQGYIANPKNVTQAQVDAITVALQKDGTAIINASLGAW